MLNYEHIKRLLFKLNPENAHNVASTAMSLGGSCPFLTTYLANKYFLTDSRLEQKIFNKTFLNPVGLAAGFDKNATMTKILMSLGFGHVEFGTLTPKPQIGNPKPRMFRYPEFESIQNAMGFNNDGLDKIKKRVEKLYPFAIPLGANIGKNKTTSGDDAINDYARLIDGLKDICDYLIINISSPNTPGLRDLQNEKFIRELFSMAKEKTSKPIVLKIAPDLEIKDALDISGVAIDSGASGIVATNTTIDYSLLPNPQNFGGISGKVLEEKSFKLFDELSREFYNKTTLISVGGIHDANGAYERIKAGASLIQVYSSFIFQGPSITSNISKGILELMNKDGFHHISEAIGANRR